MKTENLATNFKYGIDRLYLQYKDWQCEDWHNEHWHNEDWHNEPVIDWVIEPVNSPAKDRDLYLNEHTVTYRINPFLFAKVYLT